jgi:hypothetical protein
MKFIDAFIENQAPYMIQEGMFRDFKVYLPEAYTAAYMIQSDKTGRLCRWLVEKEDGSRISAYQYFGFRPLNRAWKNSLAFLVKMNVEARNQFISILFPPTQNQTDAEAVQIINEFGYAKYMFSDPDRWAACNKYQTEVYFSLRGQLN